MRLLRIKNNCVLQILAQKELWTCKGPADRALNANGYKLFQFKSPVIIHGWALCALIFNS